MGVRIQLPAEAENAPCIMARWLRLPTAYCGTRKHAKRQGFCAGPKPGRVALAHALLMPARCVACMYTCSVCVPYRVVPRSKEKPLWLKRCA